MTIGERIKAARKRAELTQEQLAQKSGVATITIRQYESDKREPRQKQIKAIANVLGVDWVELYGEPAVQEKNDFLKIIQEIGFPRGPDGSTPVTEIQQVIRRVAEFYGEKPAYLLRLLSFMDESGVDSVVDYATSIFRAHIDRELGIKTEKPPQPETGHDDE